MFGVTGLHFSQLESKHKSQNAWTYRLSHGFWVFSWTAGHILGGVIFYGLLGWLGSLLSPNLRSYSIIGLGIICVVATLQQFKIIQFPMPQLTRQVSRLWLTNLHKDFVAFGYGFQLGTGVATRIKIATTYIVIGCAICSGSVISGTIIGGLFGFSRAILPIIVASQNTLPDESLRFALKFNLYDNQIQKLNGIALLLSGGIIFFFSAYN